MIYVLHACALYHRKPIKRTRRYNDIKIFSALRGKGWVACGTSRIDKDLESVRTWYVLRLHRSDGSDNALRFFVIIEGAYKRGIK